MKKFSIHVLNPTPFKSYGMECCTGEIIIGQYKETLEMPVDYWTIKDYKKQWQEGIDRLKNHNQSCLVAELQHLEKNPRANLWVLNKIENVIYIQNIILFGKRFREMLQKETFDKNTCYNFLRPRTIFTADGDAISEWSLNVKDFFGPSFIN